MPGLRAAAAISLGGLPAMISRRRRAAIGDRR